MKITDAFINIGPKMLILLHYPVDNKDGIGVNTY